MRRQEAKALGGGASEDLYPSVDGSDAWLATWSMVSTDHQKQQLWPSIRAGMLTAPKS